MHTPNDDRLIRALHAARNARLTGALRAESGSEGVTLFYDAGHLYFATIDGLVPTTESFEHHGITRDMLNAASSAPRAADRFADALMSIGASGSDVRSFGRQAAIDGLSKAAQLVDASFSAHDRSHPYGPAFTFEADELLEALGISSTIDPEPEPTRPDAGVTAETGTGFKRRTGLRAAALAAAERS